MSTASLAKPTPRHIPSAVYWIATVLVALNFVSGGISSLLGVAAANEVFVRLGYPAYFGHYLAVWQLLAVGALLVPLRTPSLREWAYAGLVFDVISAIYSLSATKSNFVQLLPAIFILVLLMVSHRGWRQRQSVVEI